MGTVPAVLPAAPFCGAVGKTEEPSPLSRPDANMLADRHNRLA